VEFDAIEAEGGRSEGDAAFTHVGPQPAGIGAWIRGMGWLGAGSLTSLVVSALAGIVVVRILGPSGVGPFAAITVATGLASTLIVFGLDFHLVTQLNNSSSDRRSFQTSSQTAYTIAGVVTIVGALVIWTLLSQPYRWPATIDLGEVMLAPTALRQVVMQARMQQRLMAVSQGVNRLCWIAAVLLVLIARPSGDLQLLMAGRVTSAAVQGVFQWKVAALPKVETIRRLISIRDAWAVLRTSSPLAVGGLFGVGFNRIDQLLLSAFRGLSSTGLYVGGVRIAEVAGSLNPIVQSVSLPGLVKAHHSNSLQELAAAIQKSLLLSIVPGGFAVAVIAGRSSEVVALVLGPTFLKASGVLTVLAIADWARQPGTLYSSLAIATGRHRALAGANGIGFGVNVALNLLLIPILGMDGAAWASVAGYGAVAAVTARVATRGFDSAGRGYGLLARLAVVTGSTAILGRLLSTPLFEAVAVMGCVYSAAVVIVLPRSAQKYLWKAVVDLIQRARLQGAIDDG